MMFPYRCCYLIAFGKPVGHREVAPRGFDVHSIGGSPREKQKRKEGEEEEEKKKKKRRRRRRIRRRRKEEEDKAVKRKRLV